MVLWIYTDVDEDEGKASKRQAKASFQCEPSQAVIVMLLDTVLTPCLPSSWKTGASLSFNLLLSLSALINAQPSADVQEEHTCMHTGK